MRATTRRLTALVAVAACAVASSTPGVARTTRVTVIPDRNAPSGSVSKLSFRVSGVRRGQRYYVTWASNGSSAAVCSRAGASTDATAAGSTVTIGPVPYGTYGDPTFHAFCARRAYRGKVYRDRPGTRPDELSATFTFRAPSVRR